MAMSLQTAMDITQAMNSGPGPVEQMEQDEKKQQGTCHFLGHSWHWAELLFLVLTPGGVILFVVGIAALGTTVHWLFAGIFVAASLIGCGLNWNLATQKRLARSVRLLARSIKEIVALNQTMANDIKELAATKEDFTHRNQQLRDNVGRLEGNVKNLSDVENQLDRVLQEQQKIIAVRRKNNEELDRLLAKEDDLAINSARNWLIKRIKGQFESADHDGSGSVDLDGDEWKSLQGFLADNGFFLEAEDVDLDGDGQIRRIELLRAITMRMDEHMERLKRNLQKQRDLRRQLADKKKELERKKLRF